VWFFSLAPCTLIEAHGDSVFEPFCLVTREMCLAYTRQYYAIIVRTPERRGATGDKEKLPHIPLLGKQDHVAANNTLVSKLQVLGVNWY